MFKKILIANRGSIATRIERTLKKMGILSVAVYSKADQDSLHILNADEAVFLGEGTAKETYLDVEKIIKAALDTGADAIHPGYGFLSENTDFANKCEQNGIKFIGPTPTQIKLFGLKHSAREIAKNANVPLLPGTDLLLDVNSALEKANDIGYPVILKSTAGGGGIGMRICYNKTELFEAYDAVCHLAETNFNDAGVFLEKYIVRSRHIEVQIFGNEFGEVISLGERDCSVQRRNQKVVEETPAPNITDDIREKMYKSAEDLAKSASYRSAGTVEFLYDDATQEFYFLEMNTRLQVEHGITEEVFGVDLVEWMIKEACSELKDLEIIKPEKNGHSIEIRVYAEDCINNFKPSVGKIDFVDFDSNARVETFIQKGLEITSLYDPMLAKLIVHGNTRKQAIEKMNKAIENSKIYGITNNLQYLNSLIKTNEYVNGTLFTGMLKDFEPEEYAIEVLDGGVQTTVQDYPGMVGYWCVGVPPCGPMDNYSFRLGNSILGNHENASGLELTMSGGGYKFRTTTSFCITGADMNATLDGEEIPMYQVVHASASQVLKFKGTKKGMRTYLLIAGGFDMPKIMGSSATFIDGSFGGHNGRSLRTGDVLNITKKCVISSIESIPKNFQPKISNDWIIGVIPGPQPTPEYLDVSYLEELTNSTYEVNFNSARTGVRLNGKIPKWTRADGGDAGLHPSNIHDNAYAIGTLDLTGDQSVLLGPDGPSLGGFVCPVTTAKAELWKLGQLKPGDKVKFRLIDLEQAKKLREIQESNIKLEFNLLELPKQADIDYNYSILSKDNVDNTDILIRLAGEENILIEFGEMKLDIELRFRVHVLIQKLEEEKLPIIDLTPGIRSLQIHFDINKITVQQLVEIVLEINKNLGDLTNVTVKSRIINLPLSWDDPQTKLATKRYQETVRENAPWCPSNPEFIRRINGLDDISDVKDIVFNANYLVLGLGDVYLGAPVATPIDPRHRLVTTKYNPARPWTPENAVGIGGAYLCVYGMEGPGGYQFVGRTIQMWNSLRETSYFTNEKPWLLEFFDQIKFYPVSDVDILQHREDFIRGNFNIDIEETHFNLGEYKKFLSDNSKDIMKFKENQELSFEAERKMWKDKGLDKFESETEETPSIIIETIPDECEALRANVPGSVWKILVNQGDKVSKGDTLMILESMKMEFPVISEFDGIIEKICIKTSEKASLGQLVAIIRV